MSRDKAQNRTEGREQGAPEHAEQPEYSDDTIVAIATPPGRGGIGIVRLSGPRAHVLAQPLLRLSRPSAPLEPGRARFAQLLDAAGQPIDEAVVTWFAAPRSYTSEDVVEIAAHGSPVLLADLLRRCVAAGARLAEPGEFTQRAFLSGRLDLTQAEAVRDLIDASTLEQARLAARQLSGALSREIAPIKEELIRLIAALEAGIDFAEDDIDTLPHAHIAERIHAIRAPLESLDRTFAYGRIVREGFRLAIVGRPNAGKSSLFNRLVERDRAIVTATPGTTRDLITEQVSLDGIPVELTDTAGLRNAAGAGLNATRDKGSREGSRDTFNADISETLDEAEALGIARSRQAMADADVILLVLDITAGLHAEDQAILAASSRPLLIARNKTDLAPHPANTPPPAEPLPSHPAQPPALAAHTGNPPPGRVIRTSAVTGAGIAELRQAIVQAVAGEAPSSEGAMVTNLRQHQHLTGALAALTKAGHAASHAIPHEMLLLDLHESLHALDALTGATTSDDILNLIFSTFCIGK